MGPYCTGGRRTQSQQKGTKLWWDWWAIIGVTILILLPRPSACSDEAESLETEKSENSRLSSVADDIFTTCTQSNAPSVRDVFLLTKESNASCVASNTDTTSPAPDAVNLTSTCQLRPTCNETGGCNVPLYCFDFKTLPVNTSIIPDPPQTLLVTPQQLESIVEDVAMQNCCAVVLFYAPWCAFSAQFARKFNALGRSFENLPILAVDLAENEPYKYILAYLPLVAFYYRGKTLLKFRLESSFEDLRDLIANITGFTPLDVSLTDPANSVPVPTQRDTSDQYFLTLSVWWVAFLGLVQLLKSGLLRRCLCHCRTRLTRGRTKVE